MKQLTLFDIDTKERDQNMTWLDLYNYLHKKANDINNLDSKLWNSKVVIHDAETGEEYDSDTFYIDDKLTLVMNYEDWSK